MTTKEHKIYCFLGLPGSGKGTQIETFSKKLNAKVVSMGEEIRKELENADLSDPFYQKMKSLYDKGIPQPDEVAIDIVKKTLRETDSHLIFDNFPFSQNQADLFFRMCRELNVNNPELIIINISAEDSLHRIIYRRTCSDCGHIMIDNGEPICEKCGGTTISRADDNEETVRERIKNYLPRIEEVKNYFLSNGIVHEIDGRGTIKEVNLLIESII